MLISIQPSTPFTYNTYDFCSKQYNGLLSISFNSSLNNCINPSIIPFSYTNFNVFLFISIPSINLSNVILVLFSFNQAITFILFLSLYDNIFYTHLSLESEMILLHLMSNKKNTNLIKKGVFRLFDKFYNNRQFNFETQQYIGDYMPTPCRPTSLPLMPLL